MDKAYAYAVRLLLAAAPAVFANDIFATKGGSAINLFVRDMPRLSVDIDVVYRPWQTPREEALAAVADEIDAIAERLASRGMRLACRKLRRLALLDQAHSLEHG